MKDLPNLIFNKSKSLMLSFMQFHKQTQIFYMVFHLDNLQKVVNIFFHLRRSIKAKAWVLTEKN